MGDEEEQLGDVARALLNELEVHILRYEIALLSYEAQFDPDSDSPYAIRPFTLLPEWQQEIHYRVADLMIANGYKKIG